MPRTKPRQPGAIAKLHGTPGRRPLADEPEGIGDLWDCPEWFDDMQREAWRYAVIHAPVGLLTGTDRDVLVLWVVATVEHRRAAAKVSELGAVVQRGDGKVVVSPYVRVLQDQAGTILRCCQELGFSPSARAHLGASAPEGGGGPQKPGSTRVGPELRAYLDEKPDKLN